MLFLIVLILQIAWSARPERLESESKPGINAKYSRSRWRPAKVLNEQTKEKKIWESKKLLSLSDNVVLERDKRDDWEEPGLIIDLPIGAPEKKLEEIPEINKEEPKIIPDSKARRVNTLIPKLAFPTYNPVKPPSLNESFHAEIIEKEKIDEPGNDCIGQAKSATSPGISINFFKSPKKRFSITSLKINSPRSKPKREDSKKAKPEALNLLKKSSSSKSQKQKEDKKIAFMNDLELNLYDLLEEVPKGFSDLLPLYALEGTRWDRSGMALVSDYCKEIQNFKGELYPVDLLERVFYVAFRLFMERIHDLSEIKQYRQFSDPLSLDRFEHLVGGARLFYYLWPFCQYHKFRQKFTEAKADFFYSDFTIFFFHKLIDSEPVENKKYFIDAVDVFILYLTQLQRQFPKFNGDIRNYALFWAKFGTLLYELTVRHDKLFGCSFKLFPIKESDILSPFDPQNIELEKGTNCQSAKEGYLYLIKQLRKNFNLKKEEIQPK
jgi:hypothetical protein